MEAKYGCPIVTLDEYPNYIIPIIASNKKKPSIGVLSGFFQLLHEGHISYIYEARKLVDLLVIVVNGDQQAALKYNQVIIPAIERCRVLSTIGIVDLVVKLEPKDPNDLTVNEALKTIRPRYLIKGNDYSLEQIKEKQLCDKLKIKIKFVGLPKNWSSSKLLDQLKL